MEQARLAEKPSLVLTRFYPVEPEKVWRAWTDPQALKRWGGPGGAEPVAVADLDLRKGGRFRIVFGGAQGTDHEVQGSYQEVVPNRKLVFTWTWPRTTPERESVVTIELKKVPRGTELVFRHEQLFDEAVRDGHRSHWTESLVKLERVLLAERPKLTLKRFYLVAPDRRCGAHGPRRPSCATKPESGGNPAMVSAPSTKQNAVTGIRRASPPSR